MAGPPEHFVVFGRKIPRTPHDMLQQFAGMSCERQLGTCSTLHQCVALKGGIQSGRGHETGGLMSE